MLSQGNEIDGAKLLEILRENQAEIGISEEALMMLEAFAPFISADMLRPYIDSAMAAWAAKRDGDMDRYNEIISANREKAVSAGYGDIFDSLF